MKRTEKQAILKQKILDSLLRLCEGQSVYSLKTDRIAKEAEVSKRTLYEYFSSKDHMYLSMVEYAFVELNHFITSNLEAVDNDDTLKIIISIGESYLKFILKEPTLGKLITEYDEFKYNSEFPDLVKHISFVANKYEITMFLQTLFHENGMDDSIADQMGLMLWAQIYGLANLICSKKEYIYSHYKTNDIKLIDDCISYIKDIIQIKTRG